MNFCIGYGIVHDYKHSIFYIDLDEDNFDHIVTMLLGLGWAGVGFSILSGDNDPEDVMDMITGLISAFIFRNKVKWSDHKSHRSAEFNGILIKVTTNNLELPITNVIRYDGMSMTYNGFDINSTLYHINTFLGEV